VDIDLGRLQAVEILKCCPRHKYVDADGRPLVRSYGSAELARLVPSGGGHSYAVMAWIGRKRFLEHRQIDEIRTELIRTCQVQVSESQIRHLAERFLLYVGSVHRQSIGLLRGHMQQEGGWMLHMDASAEGRHLVFAALAVFGGNGQIVLYARDVVTESAGRLTDALRQARQDFGDPLAIVRDMGKGGRDAATEVFGKIPQRVCQWHFLDDVGGDILKKPHDAMRNLLRKSRFRQELRELRHDLAVAFDLEGLHPARYESFLKEGAREPGQLLWALAAWILEYPKAGQGLGFPFDLPYLELYRRVVTASPQVGHIAALRHDKETRSWVKKFRTRLARVLGRHDIGEELRRHAGTLKTLRTIFDRLRTILRLEKQAQDSASDSKTIREEARQSRQELEKFHKLAGKFSGNKHYGPEVRRAYAVVAEHIDTYGPCLFLPEVDANGKAFPEFAIQDRTNNALEGFFGSHKRGIRRCTGKKDLSREFAACGPERMIAENLSDPQYVQLLYGSLDTLAERFAQVPVEEIRHTAQERHEHKRCAGRVVTGKRLKIDHLTAAVDRLAVAARSPSPASDSTDDSVIVVGI
jgi:hypothetical protein